MKNKPIKIIANRRKDVVFDDYENKLGLDEKYKIIPRDPNDGVIITEESFIKGYGEPAKELLNKVRQQRENEIIEKIMSFTPSNYKTPLEYRKQLIKSMQVDKNLCKSNNHNFKTIVLTEKQARDFLKNIENPPKANKALRDIIKEVKKKNARYK